MDGVPYEDTKHTYAEIDTTVSSEYYVEYVNHRPDYYISRAGIVPVSLLGIVCNLVSLIVWNKQPTYNAFIFLFKYLAVWDTAFLVLFIPLMFLYDIDSNSTLTIAFDTSSCLARLVSVHTTLLIAVCRWLGMYRPLQVHNGSLLGRRQVIAGCAVTFVWSLAITAFFLYCQLWTPALVLNTSHARQILIVYIIIIPILGLAVPILLLAIFNVLLVCKLRSAALPVSSSFSRHQQHPGTWSRSRRLTLSVVLMSLCTVLSYLLGEVFLSVFIYVNMFRSDLPDDDYINFVTVLLIFRLLQQLNSSINIVFYLTFSQNFRTTCLSKFLTKKAFTRSVHS